MYDHHTQRPRGFGFVTYESEDSVDEVFKLGAIHALGDKKVECKRAVPKEHMPPGGGPGMRHGGRSGPRVPASGLGHGGSSGSTGENSSMFTSSPYGSNYAAMERSMGALSFGPGNGAGVPGYHGTGGYAGAVGQQMGAMGAYPGTFAAAAAYGAHYPTGGLMASPVGYGLSAAASAGYAGVGFPDGYSTGSPGYGTSLYTTAGTSVSALEAGGPPIAVQYGGHDGSSGMPMTLSPVAQYGLHTQQSNSGNNHVSSIHKKSLGMKQQALQINSQTEANKTTEISQQQIQDQQNEISKHKENSDTQGQTTTATLTSTSTTTAAAAAAAAAAASLSREQSVTYSSALSSGSGHNQSTDSQPHNSPSSSFGVAGEQYREYRPYFPYHM